MSGRYDYIIAGGGSAACVAAMRLVRDHGFRVLIVERGPEKTARVMRMPAGYMKYLGRDDYLEMHTTVAQSRLGGRAPIVPQAKALGGGSAVNAMVYMRGQREDYDGWDAMLGGGSGWAYADLLPHFRAQQSGTIINISSIGGKMTFPLGTLYHGTKFAVEGLSESLSYELEAIGCRVKIVEPGAIATDFTGRSFDFSNDESLAEYQSMIGTVMAGMPRLFDKASPAEVVADVIYGAATDGSDRLRYTAGDDAHAIIANRQASDDAAFIAAMKTQFGI